MDNGTQKKDDMTGSAPKPLAAPQSYDVVLEEAESAIVTKWLDADYQKSLEWEKKHGLKLP